MAIAKNKLMAVGNWAFILKGGKFLVLKRQKKEILGPGAWSVPGGKSEIGKNCYENLKREVWEETGLEIKNLKFLLHEAWRRESDWVMGFFWLAEYKSGQVKLNHEHTDYKWVSQKEITKLKTTKLNKKIIKEALKALK